MGDGLDRYDPHIGRLLPVVDTLNADGTWTAPQRHSDAWLMDYQNGQHISLSVERDIRRGSMRLKRGTV